MLLPLLSFVVDILRIWTNQTGGFCLEDFLKSFCHFPYATFVFVVCRALSLPLPLPLPLLSFVFCVEDFGEPDFFLEDSIRRAFASPASTFCVCSFPFRTVVVAVLLMCSLRSWTSGQIFGELKSLRCANFRRVFVVLSVVVCRRCRVVVGVSEDVDEREIDNWGATGKHG